MSHTTKTKTGHVSPIHSVKHHKRRTENFCMEIGAPSNKNVDRRKKRAGDLLSLKTRRSSGR